MSLKRFLLWFPALALLGVLLVASDSSAAPGLTAEELATASQVYFDRCAGCHGTMRKGATGPALTVEETEPLGVELLKTTIHEGTDAGMPAWGKEGHMTPEQVDLVARFLLEEPPTPPEYSLSEIKATWKLVVPPDKRPTKPEHDRDWQNYMGVILRDVGKVAVIDGDTKEMLNVIDTGYAVHILRSSASGRYLYSIGRDGKATMIDLWMEKPQMVAEVKTCFDARSVESSKYKGPEGDFLDKYIVVGGYWPPSLIILDGLTLEPLKMVSTSGYTCDTNEFVREARVASIVASHQDPTWVVNVKETGQIWLVDYSDLKSLKIDMIESERFLHDGGWESTQRYFLVAANMRNKVAVVDTVDRKLVALVETGIKPHPGRGANIDHPTYGPIWVTGHLGDNTLACIGTDPKGHPENAWKVVKHIELPGDAGGNLFVKTHPNSKWLCADRPVAPDPKLNRKVYFFDKNSLEFKQAVEVPEKFAGKAVHMEYNKAGDEIWVSVWGNKVTPTAMLVIDDNTLKITHEITGDWVRTPTGHFNVYNTMKDIY